MSNKVRYIIYPDRVYVIKLDNGTELEIPGHNIIEMAKKTSKLISFFERSQIVEKGDLF